MSTKTVIPFGPQHPVLPEPIHLRLTLEDEKIIEAVPALGYVHRGIEKAAESREFTQAVYLMERVCGICSFVHAVGYCQAIEAIMGIEVPTRANFLRVIYAELTRMHSHVLYLGLLADAIGYESLFMHCWRVRETVVDLMEKTAGSRVIISTAIVGGIRRDISEDLCQEILRTHDKLMPQLDRIADIFAHDPTLRNRTIGVGILNQKDARSSGAVGPMLRATGVSEDVRSTGYSAYGELDFKPIVETGCDSYSRSVVRLREVFQSVDLINQAIKKMPEGEIATKFRGNPDGEAFTRVEAPRGELLYYAKGNGTKNLARMRVRTPTYANIPSLLIMLPGSNLPDVPVITLSIDPCFSCTER